MNIKMRMTIRLIIKVFIVDADRRCAVAKREFLIEEC